MRTNKPPHTNRFSRSKENDCENALSLMARGDHEGALARLEAVLAKEPDNLQALVNKGVCLDALGQFIQAARHLHSVHESAPSHSLILKLCAQVHDRANYLDMALEFWSLYTKAKPDDYDAWAGMTNVALRSGKFAPAVMFATQALALKPQHSHAYNNLGSALMAVNRLDAAEQALETAVALEPGHALALGNLALISYLRGNHKEAVRAYESLSLERNLEPTAMAEFFFRSSFAYLGAGQLKEGWRRYEYGFEVKDMSARWPQRKFAVPRWTGEPLGDKRLLVWGEQGLGDELWFYGLLHELQAHCQNILLECDPRLVSLLQRSFPEITVRAQNRKGLVERQDYDTHIPAGSLMGIFRTNIDDFKRYRPYIKPDPKLVKDFSHRLKPYAGKKLVGLCWRSGVVDPHRIKQYMVLNDFSEILQNPDYMVVNLQYGDCEAEVLRVEQALGIHVVRWADVDLKDDQEALAALMIQLDVVLAPPTAVQRLASAVGVQVISFSHKDWTAFGQEYAPCASNEEHIYPDAAQPLTTVLPRILSSLKVIGTRDPSSYGLEGCIGAD
jgi:Flp pilus assembly protein TadD